MSDQAENWAAWQATSRAMPDPCLRRYVLMALAERHVGGPFTVPTGELARALNIHPVTLWPALIALRKAGLIEASNIGGLMTVTLAFDLPEDHPAHVPALPAAKQETA